MQRSCNDQGWPGVCLSMHLSVVEWTQTKYFGQGNNFIRCSQEMGDTPRKGGVTMQTQREQTSRGYTVQSAHSRWYGITRVHRKVQANHWCMWMARRHEGDGSQERYSPSKESRSLSKCLEEDQDSLTAERVIEIATLLYNSDCQRSIMQTPSTATAAATAIQQGLTQIHKVQTNHQKGGKSTKWSNQDKTSKDKEHGETKR